MVTQNQQFAIMSNHSYDDNSNHRNQPDGRSAFASVAENESGTPSTFSRRSSNIRPSTHPQHVGAISVAEAVGAARRVPASSSSSSTPILTVHDHDVLCGRGVNIAHHPGNERFRSLVTTNADAEYCTAYSVSEKKAVAHQIIQHIKDLDPPGRFLQREGSSAVSRGLEGPWEELPEKAAVKKTCQALRDCNRHDRSGYAKGVSAPVDVKNFVDKASKAGLTVKDRAVATASTLKSKGVLVQGETNAEMAPGKYKGAYSSPGRSQSRTSGKGGGAIQTSRSTSGKRSRDEFDDAYYANIYSSVPDSSYTSGVGSGAAYHHPNYANSNSNVATSKQNSNPSTKPSFQSSAAELDRNTVSNYPQDYSRPTSDPASVQNSELEASKPSPPREYANYTAYQGRDHHQQYPHHQQEHLPHQYQHGQIHPVPGYSYPSSNPQTYSYGYNQTYSAEPYHASYDPHGYPTDNSSVPLPSYQNYTHYPPPNPDVYNAAHTGHSQSQRSYRHQHQFHTVDESWSLKKQRTDDTDPSLTSTTGVSTSTTENSASSPFDGALDIVPSMPGPNTTDHSTNNPMNESVPDFFKEGDDSWTRGLPIDPSTDGTGIGVAHNSSMDGAFGDPIEDGLFSFDNNEKY